MTAIDISKGGFKIVKQQPDPAKMLRDVIDLELFADAYEHHIAALDSITNQLQEQALGEIERNPNSKDAILQEYQYTLAACHQRYFDEVVRRYEEAGKALGWSYVPFWKTTC